MAGILGDAFKKWKARKTAIPNIPKASPFNPAVTQLQMQQVRLNLQQYYATFGAHGHHPLRYNWATSDDMEQPKILAICPSGSRVICDPPVLDTDEDKFILVDRLPSKKKMQADGWTLCGRETYSGYVAWRKGEKNWIFTTNRDEYLRTYAATLLAKELNLTKKEDRVALFAVVTYQNGPDYKGPLPTKGFL